MLKCFRVFLGFRGFSGFRCFRVIGSRALVFWGWRVGVPGMLQVLGFEEFVGLSGAGV